MQPMEFYDCLAERGYTVDQAVQATDRLLELGHTAESSVKLGILPQLYNALANMSAVGLSAAAIVPPAAGYYAGGQLAKHLDAKGRDVKSIKTEELIRELEANTKMLKNRRRLRDKKEGESGE